MSGPSPAGPPPLRLHLLLVLAGLAGLLPLLNDAFLPALYDMAQALDVPVSAAQLAMSAPLASFAVAQLLLGLAADRFGRRPVLLLAVGVFVLASLMCMLADSLAVIVAGRALQAAGAAAGPVLMRTIVRDLYDREEGARVLSLVGMCFGLVPLLSPIVSSHLTDAYGWRAVFAMYAVYGGAVWLSVWVSLGETAPSRDPAAFNVQRMIAALRAILGHRESLGHTLACVFGFCGLFTYISSAPYLLIDHYGVSTRLFGYVFAIPVSAFVAGGLLSSSITRRLGSVRTLRIGLSLLLAGVLLLVLAGVAGLGGLGLFLAGAALYHAGWGVVQPQSQAGALEAHGALAGRASAVLGFVQLAAGASAGMLFAHLFTGTPDVVAALVLLWAVLCTASALLLTRTGFVRATA